MRLAPYDQRKRNDIVDDRHRVECANDRPLHRHAKTNEQHRDVEHQRRKRDPANDDHHRRQFLDRHAVEEERRPPQHRKPDEDAPFDEGHGASDRLKRLHGNSPGRCDADIVGFRRILRHSHPVPCGETRRGRAPVHVTIDARCSSEIRQIAFVPILGVVRWEAETSNRNPPVGLMQRPRANKVGAGKRSILEPTFRDISRLEQDIARQSVCGVILIL